MGILIKIFGRGNEFTSGRGKLLVSYMARSMRRRNLVIVIVSEIVRAVQLRAATPAAGNARQYFVLSFSSKHLGTWRFVECKDRVLNF